MLGPTSIKRFGNPATVVPCNASSLPLPAVREAASIPPVDHARYRRFGRAKPRRADHHVKDALPSVGGDEAVPVNPHEGVCHQLDVGLRQGRIVVVADQDAFAADAVVRGEFGAQHGVSDVRLQKLFRLSLQPRAEHWSGKTQVLEFSQGKDGLPGEALQEGRAAKPAASPFAYRFVLTGKNPGRGALKHRELRRHPLKCGTT